MYDCECLIHPFQNDPGTSQSQRVMDELLSGAAKIDARTLADLLDYFVQLSRHINFYDTNLNVSDWQPFFKKSVPFVLASVIKNQSADIENNLTYYNSLFSKKPSSPGLQLEAYYIFYRFINKINDWQLAIADSNLPVESYMQKLVKDKLSGPLKLFISYANAAAKYYGTRKIDFSKLQDNDSWNLELTDLYAIDATFKAGTTSKFKRRNNLFENFKTIASPFIDAANTISSEAVNSLQQSLLPLKDELQKKHPPHLGLLFAFLNIFRYLQDDLNSYTRKHLDFFYKDVLQIKSRDAVADKAHIIFEIQKQLSNYLIKKGILVKDGKDKNKQQVLFSLDDEIVVNKTEVAELRTLYFNKKFVPDPLKDGVNLSLTEGVYIAQDATKADGVDKDFDTDVKNFYTLGNKESKYALPETKVIQPYPGARLGLILGSPVLYLKEGRRTVNVTLACQMQDPGLDENDAFSPVCNGIDYPNLYSTKALFNKVSEAIRKYYVYISEAGIIEAKKKGVSNDTIDRLRTIFLKEDEKEICGRKIPVYKQDEMVSWKFWWDNFYKKFYVPNADVSEKAVIDALFAKRRVFKILFSGEKGWLEATRIKRLHFTELTEDAVTKKKTFAIKFKAIIEADKPAVTFFDKSVLKEDYDTTMPVVKIELDDLIKIKRGFNPPPNACCLNKSLDNSRLPISFYYFLRNLKIIDITDPNVSGHTFNTEINVKVCGLKNFIVQNDESVQDVNGPVYPFGVRPIINSNFYIGSLEIFSKNWNSIQINHNWKNKPAVSFEEYYTAYQHMFIDPNDINIKTIEGIIKDNNYKASVAILKDGIWYDDGMIICDETGVNVEHLLFRSIYDGPNLCSDASLTFNFAYKLERNDFSTLPVYEKSTSCTDITKLSADTRNCFLRISLKCQNFQHERYAFILSRQMMAFGRLPADLVAGAYYRANPANAIIVFNSVGALAGNLDNNITILQVDAGNTKTQTAQTVAEAQGGGGTGAGTPVDIEAQQADNAAQATVDSAQDVSDAFDELKINIPFLPFLSPSERTKLEAVIPNEPWTPIISNMSLDYTATAAIEDIDLIHLYPYNETYKHEEIQLQPTLLPTFCDEGTLFLGLKNLVPGNSLNILFQLAEATSDSESLKQDVEWHYLDSNVWKSLRTGFEVLDDASENLTTSGIIKFAMPENMTNDNTVMPKGLHWIKASVPQNSHAVSETTGIHPQAISVTFTNDVANDQLRLTEPLAAGSISKLNIADAFVKSVQQPFDSFGGLVPEAEQQYYVRVSERLRHKGRAIQKFDYERIILEAFPQVFKAKCINHSFALDAHLYKNDFPYAPGYVILALIPDLYKLKAGNSFEPKVPVSILEKVEAYIRKRTSPFVRFRATNPRYEKLNFSLRVNLLPGKDENYYTEKLKEDLRELLAPWAVGKYDKLTFGQCVYKSDVIHFLENTDYVDFITDFKMGKENDVPTDAFSKLCPDTPRSILIAGDIEVCINPPDCDDWKICYDDKQNKIDCCETPIIPVADYCPDKIITIG